MLQTRRPALSGNALKGIAILAMTLDHLTWTLWPGYSTAWWVLLLHLLGRVTAPIMWFFVVEGYHYTHDVKKYAVHRAVQPDGRRLVARVGTHAARHPR